ncbi:MAG: glycosyltransferase [Gemmatales bacterium]|nr:glycosyltransferase family 2 protein [Gemmatales bacterium]MDW8174675.1 glycosyltransferase [Gemmatales bacterium]
MPEQRSLTIACTSYRDTMGVFFTMMSLAQLVLPRLNTKWQIELAVADNDPNNPHTNPVALLCRDMGIRYIIANQVVGTSFPRNAAIRESRSDYVMVLDSHVLIDEKGLSALLRYLEENHPCDDLLHGPIVSPNGNKNDVYVPVWRNEMFGIWSKAWHCVCKAFFFTVCPDPVLVNSNSVTKYLPLDCLKDGTIPVSQEQFVEKCPSCSIILPQLSFQGHEQHLMQRGFGLLVNGDTPYIVPAMATGLFCVRRESWLGLPEEHRGYGGEEVTLHYDYWKRGRRVVVIPQLRWWHYFGRRLEQPPVRKWDKVRNFVIYFHRLGLPLDSIYQHFVEGRDNQVQPRLTQDEWQYLTEDPLGRTEPPTKSGSATASGNTASSTTDAKNDPGRRCYGSQHDQLPAPQNLPEGLPRAYRLQAWAVNWLNRELRNDKDAVGRLMHSIATMSEVISSHQRIMLRGPDGKELVLVALLPHLKENQEVIYDGKDIKVPADLLPKGLHVQSNHPMVPLDDDGDLLILIRPGDNIVENLNSIGRPGRILLVGTGNSNISKHFAAKWAQQYPEYTVAVQAESGIGVMMLSRLSIDKKSLPPLWRQAINYGKFLLQRAGAWLTGIKMEVSPAEVQRRLEICAICPARVGGRCAECGCYLDKMPNGKFGRAWFRKPGCPLKKWPGD